MATQTDSQDRDGPGEATSAAEEDRAAERLGQEMGHFRLLSVLGRGGMGVVYLADDLTLRRRVALKVLPARVALDEERRRRFLREARAASAITHPGVAAVYEVGEDGADLFLVMEHVPGQTLRDRLLERGALEVREALRLAEALASAMISAHEASVIHRDLKPANVMITAAGAVKILDFGVARSLASGDSVAEARTESAFATREGQILGTPGYMAPEQAHGRAVDARADVFSFGVVLYEMLTGARPFQGDTPLERLVAADRDAPPPPSSRRDGIPAALDRIVLRCLAKRPEDRFEGFRALAAALTAVPLPSAAPAPRRAFGPTAMGVTLSVGLAMAGAWSISRRPVAAPPLALTSAPLTSASAAPHVTPRRPCLAGEPGATRCTLPSVIAWCDLEGRPVGCCGKGLVPAGLDGICACAPGGTAVPEVLARGCPARPASVEELARSAKRAALDKAVACFKPGLDAGWSRGGEFAAEFHLTPEGEVFGARVNLSTVPDAGAQVCALEALRSTRFPPPLGEEVGERESFGFELMK